MADNKNQIIIRGDSIYILVDMDKSTDPPSWFNSGRTEANKVGGELATVTTKDEYTFIVDSFKNETDRAIIGLHDSSDDLEYRWTSGEEVDLSQLDSELKLDLDVRRKKLEAALSETADEKAALENSREKQLSKIDSSTIQIYSKVVELKFENFR